MLISADGHTGAPPEAYRSYLERRYLPDLEALAAENDEWCRTAIKWKAASPEILDIVDEDHVVRTDGESGAWDMARRVKELDREGVACELLISGHQCSTLPFFGIVNRPQPAELRMAGTRAYHRWLFDSMSEAPGRFYGIAEPGPCLDMQATVEELRWAAAHRFVGVQLPGNVKDPNLPALHSEYFEPFWAACAELGLVLVIHAGWGGRQGDFQKFVRLLQREMGNDQDIHKIRKLLESRTDSPLHLDMGPRRALWQLMLGGAFDRHPELRVALTEVRADWVPATLAHLDRRWADLGSQTGRKPSEYYALHCVATPSSPHRAEIELRHELGVSRLLFGVDYPHPEATWPNTLDWIRDGFRGVPENEARMILGENAVRFYRLDRQSLQRLAQKIGPEIGAVLGEHTVDPRKIAHFHQRAGYSSPVQSIKTGDIDQPFDQDVKNVVRNSEPV
jgi:predicted TIM-barrel fold metal-dependent hydrolase